MAPDGSGIRLVVGLGNPGREYEKTRHNVGFMVLDRLVEAGAWRWEAAWKALCAVEAGVIYCKPQAYMNLSGRCVAAVAAFYKVPPERILVVLDDLSLDLGRLRIRVRGSSGGHRGLQSVVECLGTVDVPRLRIGIGRGDSGEVSDYVLGAFRDVEWTVLQGALCNGEDAVKLACREGLSRAMNSFN